MNSLDGLAPRGKGIFRWLFPSCRAVHDGHARGNVLTDDLPARVGEPYTGRPRPALNAAALNAMEAFDVRPV
ncbi:MAG: hypothetical protein QM682_14155 [Paracoccus sp. (in: a-proteobacteria)]|uniref:hypothetical protein n=1 Tax=Paracoccus sp. TaxID=267 RepID=UPI0039E68CBD